MTTSIDLSLPVQHAAEVDLVSPAGAEASTMKESITKHTDITSLLYSLILLL